MVRVGLEVSRIQHYARPSGAMLEHARSFAGMRAIEESEFSGQSRAKHAEKL
jgi:hypothetical protein